MHASFWAAANVHTVAVGRCIQNETWKKAKNKFEARPTLIACLIKKHPFSSIKYTKSKTKANCATMQRKNAIFYSFVCLMTSNSIPLTICRWKRLSFSIQAQAASCSFVGIYFLRWNHTRSRSAPSKMNFSIRSGTQTKWKPKVDFPSAPFIITAISLSSQMSSAHWVMRFSPPWRHHSHWR